MHECECVTKKMNGEGKKYFGLLLFALQLMWVHMPYEGRRVQSFDFSTVCFTIDVHMKAQGSSHFALLMFG